MGWEFPRVVPPFRWEGAEFVTSISMLKWMALLFDFYLQEWFTLLISYWNSRYLVLGTWHLHSTVHSPPFLVVSTVVQTDYSYANCKLKTNQIFSWIPSSLSNSMLDTDINQFTKRRYEKAKGVWYGFLWCALKKRYHGSKKSCKHQQDMFFKRHI